MRRRMIEALSFPRMLILGLIDERECPHRSLFEATSQRCSGCDLNRECHWVRCLNDFEDFDDVPIHTISASLRYGMKLVESYGGETREHDTVCACETCTWLRKAGDLIEEFEGRRARGLNRPVLS